MKLHLVSVGLFLLSLTQPCYCTTSNCADSIMVLLIGWMGVFTGGAALTWLANPALLLAWLTVKRSTKTAFVSSMFATVTALSFLFFGDVTANESGQSQSIVSYQAGYWLWLGSALAMMLGSAWAHRVARRQTPAAL